MGIGIGIFLGLVFIGTTYLYTQTRDSWNWRKIWKWIGVGILALIVIPLAVGSIVWVYSSISDYYASKPKVISSLHGLNLGEKLHMNISPLINAIRITQAINTAEIIAGIAAEDRSNGERIGSAFESARLSAITAALVTQNKSL